MALKILLVLVLLKGIAALSEQGSAEGELSQNQTYLVFTKSLYHNSTISVKLACSMPDGQETEVHVDWVLRLSPCANEFINIDTDQARMQQYLEYPENFFLDQYDVVKYKAGGDKFICKNDGFIHLTDKSDGTPYVIHHPLKPAADAGPAAGPANGPVSGPVSGPASGPATGPVSGPVSGPATGPAGGPVAGPAGSPVAGPAGGPVADPVAGPATGPAGGPVADPVAGPATGPAGGPVADPVAGPATGPAGGPVADPVAGPATGPAGDPVAGPAGGPVAGPAGSPVVVPAGGPDTGPHTRRKREANNPTPTLTPKPTVKDVNLNKLVTSWEDGIYVFIMRIKPMSPNKPFKVNVEVKMEGLYGDLSAIEWPLLPFYGTMCMIYVIYGLVWLVLSACNWRDLLRIQFWIGGVIFLGMLEKAMYFAEYESINNTGKSVRGAVVFAELVSCLKRTLARMLVVIVSLGFGIVKPRLGPMLHRVLAMGALYFILSAVEGTVRALRSLSDQSHDLIIATVPLAVLDAAICWWIFSSLVQTTRTLRLRRNVVKLSLYRHFTNTLIFSVVASIAFMIWSLSQHKMKACISDWKELWVDAAFWHLLFSVLLLVIMVLWRPSANNQRYAFSPLLDTADDEAEEPMINEAFDGMKMRGQPNNGSPKMRGDNNTKAEEDLKWIEENIPTSVTDTALPSLLDSDEEVMNTKYEMSKME